MLSKIRVTVWNEYWAEKRIAEDHYDPNDWLFSYYSKVAENYPQGIHNTIAGFLKKQPDFEVRTATMDQPEYGLTEEVLNTTDVLVWWSHLASAKRFGSMDGLISNAVIERIYNHVVFKGTGMIFLHSGIFSQIATRILGSSSKVQRGRNLQATYGKSGYWKEGEKERLWVVAPGHPIVEGIGEYIELEHEELFGEPFDIQPDELVFISWFKGGEIFRSGCCFYRGMGKVFFFRPGHETFPIYHDPNIQKVISNAVRWAAPVKRPFNYNQETSHLKEPLEKIG